MVFYPPKNVEVNIYRPGNVRLNRENYVTIVMMGSNKVHANCYDATVYGKDPRFHVINLQPTLNVAFASKKKGTYPTIGIKIG